MLRIISGTIVVLSFLTACGQPNVNLKLKRELDSIYVLDQVYREILFSGGLKDKADSLAEAHKIPVNELSGYLVKVMQKVDSSNMIRIEKILDDYGYPGKSLVGIPTNESAFFVIQHSDSKSIDKYLPVIKKAARKKELPFDLYAMMLDRSLMNKGKEQIYGSQGKGLRVINPETGTKDFKMFIWPIKNPGTVDDRRKKAGFDLNVSDNAKRLGIEYTVLTLKDVKNMQKEH